MYILCIIGTIIGGLMIIVGILLFFEYVFKEDKNSALDIIAGLLFTVVGVLLFLFGSIIGSSMEPECFIVGTEQYLESNVPYVEQEFLCFGYDDEQWTEYKIVEIEQLKE